MLNKDLLENNIDFVATYAVQGSTPDVSVIQKAKQGSSDPEAPWSKA